MMRMDSHASVLINAEEAWVLCGMKKTAWYKYLSKRMIPAPVRVNGFVRWRRQELLDWMDAGCPPQAKWVWKPSKKT